MILVTLFSLLLARAWAGDTPRVVLTRVFEHGESESLVLKCVPDPRRDELFCQCLRHRNGVEVEAVPLRSGQAQAIVEGFFRLWPKRKGQPVPKGPAAIDPSYIWDVALGADKATGFVTRSDPRRDPDEMKALFSLEGALAAQFYR